MSSKTQGSQRENKLTDETLQVKPPRHIGGFIKTATEPAWHYEVV